MRTIDPASVVTDFLKQIDEIEAWHNRISAGVANPPLSLTEKRALAETTFMALGSALESFLSDVFVAHVSRAPSQMWTQLRLRAPGNWPAQLVGRHRGHISEDCILEALDPGGLNVGYRDASALVHKAAIWMVTARAAKFTGLTAAERWVIDAVKAVRNHIAHRSRKSSGAMDVALRATGGPVLLWRTGTYTASDVGTYLTGPMGARNRLSEYLRWVRAVARRLA